MPDPLVTDPVRAYGPAARAVPVTFQSADAMHHRPLVEAYRAHPVPGLEHHVFRTDHALSDHRVALARTVIAFLDRHLKGDPR